MVKLCLCGCGKEVKTKQNYIHKHRNNLSINNCLCGCGKETQKGMKYIKFHHLKDKNVIENRVNTFKKNGKMIGNRNWENRDHEKMVEKIRFACRTEEFRKAQSERTTIALNKPEVKQKMKGKRKQPMSEEGKLSIKYNRLFRYGPCGSARIAGDTSLGITYSEEVNKKKGRSGKQNAMSKLEHRLKLMGPNCHLWNGGIAFEPYAPGFVPQLKKIIKERDNFICQLCDVENKILHIHHIDYNKKNHSFENLISLCNPCHAKTNQNRGEWQKILIAKIQNELTKQEDFSVKRQSFSHILNTFRI